MKHAIKEQKTPTKGKKRLSLPLIISIIMLAALPVLLFGVRQQLDLRKRAASHPPTGTNPIAWITNDATLTADGFYVFANGAYFWGNPQTQQVHSDSPDGDGSSMTLETTWHESINGNLVEMRVNMYFSTDKTTWWVDEIRTYNGRIPGDWAEYTGRYFESPVGSHFNGTVDLTSDATSPYPSRIHFTNLRLTAFKPAAPLQCFNEVIEYGGQYVWPDGCRGIRTPGVSCTQALTPLTPEELVRYTIWQADGSPPTPDCGVITIPTISPTARQLQFRIKLAGVSGNEAEGAQVSVRFARGTANVSPPVPIRLVYIGDGTYLATTLIDGDLLPEGSGYVLIIKGEKHLAQRFCALSGQDAPCEEGQTFSIPRLSPAPLVFDLIGLPLEPGDTYPQDGVVNRTDMNRVKTLLDTSSSALTEADKRVGDLDYNGTVNFLDILLLRRTLETRYDAN